MFRNKINLALNKDQKTEKEINNDFIDEEKRIYGSQPLKSYGKYFKTIESEKQKELYL